MIIDEGLKTIFSSFLSHFPVSSAHRLKNPQSVLYTSIMESLNVSHKLLLTGTPVQNDLKELWALVHFIMPTLFDDLEDWLTCFGPLEKEEEVKTFYPICFFLMRISMTIRRSWVKNYTPFYDHLFWEEQLIFWICRRKQRWSSIQVKNHLEIISLL